MRTTWSLRNRSWDVSQRWYACLSKHKKSSRCIELLRVLPHSFISAFTSASSVCENLRPRSLEIDSLPLPNAASLRQFDSVDASSHSAQKNPVPRLRSFSAAQRIVYSTTNLWVGRSVGSLTSKTATTSFLLVALLHE